MVLTFLLAYWKPLSGILLMLGLFCAGWYNGALHEEKKHEVALAKSQLQAFERYTLEVVKNNQLAKDLEEVRAKREVDYQDVVQKVEKIVGRPVYRNVCIDDGGLRIISDAIDGKGSDAGKPAERMRAVDKTTLGAGG